MDSFADVPRRALAVEDMRKIVHGDDSFLQESNRVVKGVLASYQFLLTRQFDRPGFIRLIVKHLVDLNRILHERETAISDLMGRTAGLELPPHLRGGRQSALGVSGLAPLHLM